MLCRHLLGFVLFSGLLGIEPQALAQQADIPEAPVGHLKDLQPDDPERIEMARVQVFLDRAGFRPGKIDGLGGEFTQKAADRYCIAKKLPPGSRLPVEEVAHPYRDYVVVEEDMAWIGPTASKPAEQAKLKRLPYGDSWEALAEKFHCDLNFFKALNATFTEPPKVGDTVRVVDVEPFDMNAVVALEKRRREEKKNPTPTPDPTAVQTADPTPTPTPEPVLSLVLLREPRIIELYEDDQLVGSFPCTPGSDKFPVPPGDWKITSNTLMPYYRWDKSVLESGKRSDEAYNLPPGPNNPVGIVWLALNIPSRGMHGTTSPDQIGRNASAGCVRLANWDAWVLAQRVKAGTRVKVF